MIDEQENRNNISNHDNPQQSNNNSDRSCYLAIRGSFVGVILIGVMLNSIFGFVLPSSNVLCIVDYSFKLTASVNSFFANDQYSKFLLLIFSSICVDLVMVMLGLFWIMFGKSWRVIITLIIFYLFKFFVQTVFQEKVPEGMIWEYPGFPSIMISYLNTNTFFYSTAVGFLLISSLEFWKLKNYYLYSFSIASLVLHILTCNFLRGNYIIDIISALVIAHFIFTLVDEISPKYLDNSKSEWFNLEENNDPQTGRNIYKDTDYKPLNNKDLDKNDV